MLDFNLILEDPKKLTLMLNDRNWGKFDVGNLQELIEDNKLLTGQIQKLNANKNSLTEDIGNLLKKNQKHLAEKEKEKVSHITIEIEKIAKKTIKYSTTARGTFICVTKLDR